MPFWDILWGFFGVLGRCLGVLGGPQGILGGYFGGMLKEPLVDKSPGAEGRDKLTANLRLGLQATVVLGLLFLGFMAANGLL